MTLHVVSFSSHQPYMHLFHKMDLKFDLILIKDAYRFLQNWDERVRPLPERWKMVTLEQAKVKAARGFYQVAMAHNINDYLDLVKLGLPVVLVLHTALSSRFKEERTDLDMESYRRQFAALVTRTGGSFVFVSETKQNDWGLPGTVIVNGIDPDDYWPYHGRETRLLRVANHFKERGEILGYDAHSAISQGFAVDLVGENPSIPSLGPASSWDDLKGYYQSRRAYLHTATPGLEDGYNLSVMEAMVSGMPVISTLHPTSPVVDGVNGFISNDLERLRGNVRELMANQELATRLGREARETAVERYSFRRFSAQWQEVLETLAAGNASAPANKPV